MELPVELIKIIKEYSMPLTRPDWQTCGKFKQLDFMYALFQKYPYTFIALYNDKACFYSISFIMKNYILTIHLN